MISRAMLILPLCVLLNACTGIGILGIKAERNEYNNAISETSNQQLMSNLIRAEMSENPSFFDLTEIDQTKSISGNLQGGSTTIGALSGTGSLTSMMTITDGPILKYQIPSSAGYIFQILNPIPIETIAYFYNSNVPTVPLLLMAFNNITPRYIDYDPAIDLIDVLGEIGAITFDASGDHGIIITKRPAGFNSRRAASTVGDHAFDCFPKGGSGRPITISGLADQYWIKLAGILMQPPSGPLYLRPSGTKFPKKTSPDVSSVAVTRSALGVLRLAGGHNIRFIDKAEGDRIIDGNKASSCSSGEFLFDGKSLEDIDQKWKQYFVHVSAPISQHESEDERALDHDRTLIIIEVSQNKPASSFAVVERSGRWYSIRDDDDVSKANFALLGNIIIVQAQAPSSPPTPTTIVAPH